MGKKVDTKNPIRFYDDRDKVKEKFMSSKILFEDEEICLCLIKNIKLDE